MRVVLSLMSTLSLVVAANAATVTPLSDGVSLSQGRGFNRITAAVEGNPGDRVMTGANGRAQIVYPNGCTITVEAGKVVTIPEMPNCDLGLPADATAIGAIAVGVGAAVVIFATKKGASP